MSILIHVNTDETAKPVIPRVIFEAKHQTCVLTDAILPTFFQNVKVCVFTIRFLDSIYKNIKRKYEKKPPS